MIIFSIGMQMIWQHLLSCSRFSDRPIWIHNWLYIFPSVEFSVYALTFYNVKIVRPKALVCFKMFAFEIFFVIN